MKNRKYILFLLHYFFCNPNLQEKPMCKDTKERFCSINKMKLYSRQRHVVDSVIQNWISIISNGAKFHSTICCYAKTKCSISQQFGFLWEKGGGVGILVCSSNQLLCKGYGNFFKGHYHSGTSTKFKMAATITWVIVDHFLNT